MKFSDEQIIRFFNQALRNETGYEGRLNVNTITWDGYEVVYKSESNTTIIKIFNTSIIGDDLQNETVMLGSKGDDYNFQFYC